MHRSAPAEFCAMTSGQPDDYQIRVHVIEARQLRGADGAEDAVRLSAVGIRAASSLPDVPRAPLGP